MCIVHISKVVYMCIVTYKNESRTFSTGELIKLDMCMVHMSISMGTLNIRVQVYYNIYITSTHIL